MLQKNKTTMLVTHTIHARYVQNILKPKKYIQYVFPIMILALKHVINICNLALHLFITPLCSNFVEIS